MLLLTDKYIEVELFGSKLKLSERTARDQQKMLAAVNAGVKTEDGLMLIAITVRDGLKINLLPYSDVKWFELKRKRELKRLKAIINPDKLMELPTSFLTSLQDEILKLEGVDLEDIKKKVTEAKTLKSKAGLAVTLEPA